MSTTEPTPIPGLAWAVLGVVLVGEVLDLLDSLITTVAGPPILRDLGGGETFLQWLSAAYTLAMAGGLLIGGRLGDRFGRRRVLLVGMAGFTVTSVGLATAISPAEMLAVRVLQGLLGALMLPQGLGLLRGTFPPDRAGVAFGIFGPTMALSALAGPIVAGWLVDADVFGWGWRTVFAVNVPLGIIGVLLGLRVLPPSPPDHGITVDLVGAGLAVAASTALVLPLVQGRERGWPWWCFALFGVAAMLLVVFGRQQVRREQHDRAPLVVPALFRRRSFTAGLGIGLFFFAALMGSGIVLAVLLQLGLGLTPGDAALTTTPQALGMVAGFALGQRLGVRRRTLVTGLFVAAGGQTLLAITLLLGGAAFGRWWLAPGLLMAGTGAGTAMGPFFDVVLAGVGEGETGSASGVITAVQQLGAATGVAILGTVLFSVLDRPGMPGPGPFAEAAAWAFGVGAALAATAALLAARLLPVTGGTDQVPTTARPGTTGEVPTAPTAPIST